MYSAYPSNTCISLRVLKESVHHADKRVSCRSNQNSISPPTSGGDIIKTKKAKHGMIQNNMVVTYPIIFVHN